MVLMQKPQHSPDAAKFTAANESTPERSNGTQAIDTEDASSPVLSVDLSSTCIRFRGGTNEEDPGNPHHSSAPPFVRNSPLLFKNMPPSSQSPAGPMTVHPSAGQAQEAALPSASLSDKMLPSTPSGQYDPMKLFYSQHSSMPVGFIPPGSVVLSDTSRSQPTQFMPEASLGGPNWQAQQVRGLLRRDHISGRSASAALPMIHAGTPAAGQQTPRGSIDGSAMQMSAGEQGAGRSLQPTSSSHHGGSADAGGGDHAAAWRLKRRQRGKEQRDSEKALLAGLQAEEVQLETSIVALKRQQAALSAIGAAMMHECAPEFLPELSKAQEGLTAAHRSLSACLQSSADQDAGDQSLQHSRAGSREASSDTLVTATDQALMSLCEMASLRQGLVERGAWQLEGFSGASQALGVSRIDVALGGIPLSTWMQYFIASGSSSNLDFSVQTTCKQLQASWKEMETRLHSCLEALVDQYRLECMGSVAQSVARRLQTVAATGPHTEQRPTFTLLPSNTQAGGQTLESVSVTTEAMRPVSSCTPYNEMSGSQAMALLGELAALIQRIVASNATEGDITAAALDSQKRHSTGFSELQTSAASHGEQLSKQTLTQSSGRFSGSGSEGMRQELAQNPPMAQLLGISHAFRKAALTNARALLPVRAFASFLLFPSDMDEASNCLSELLGREAPATVKLGQFGALGAPSIE